MLGMEREEGRERGREGRRGGGERERKGNREGTLVSVIIFGGTVLSLVDVVYSHQFDPHVHCTYLVCRVIHASVLAINLHMSAHLHKCMSVTVPLVGIETYNTQ